MVDPFKVAMLGMVITLGAQAQEQERRREPLPAVISAEIVSHSALTIKPCQRVTIQGELEVDRPVPLAMWEEVVRSMSQSVVVNGERFRNPLSGSGHTTNDAAWFALLDPRREQRATDSQRETSSALVEVEFFLKLRAREYLFADAREYHIELVAGDQQVHLEVNVEQATPQEREIIDGIEAFPVMMFLIGPTNRQYATPEVVSLVESLARKDTDYAKMLSLAVGLASRPSGLPDNPTEAEFRQRSIERARERFAWLNPHFMGRINSRREATAAFECGMAAGFLGQSETDEKKAKAYLARQQELWEIVSGSPLAFGPAARAGEFLEKLGFV